MHDLHQVKVIWKFCNDTHGMNCKADLETFYFWYQHIRHGRYSVVLNAVSKLLKNREWCELCPLFNETQRCEFIYNRGYHVMLTLPMVQFHWNIYGELMWLCHGIFLLARIIPYVLFFRMAEVNFPSRFRRFVVNSWVSVKNREGLKCQLSRYAIEFFTWKVDCGQSTKVTESMVGMVKNRQWCINCPMMCTYERERFLFFQGDGMEVSLGMVMHYWNHYGKIIHLYMYTFTCLDASYIKATRVRV
jgi:hypothetical protein